MANDPNATPASPSALPVASSPASSASATPASAAGTPGSAASRPSQDQVSFWASFFLGQTKPGEYAVYHHSTLFYWWPVWAFGFLFALTTWWGNRHMAVVPDGARAESKRQVEVEPGKLETRDVIILRAGETHVTRKDPLGNEEVFQPTIYMARQKGVGTLFVIILLLVIIITNITMRGLWSVFVLVVIVMLSVIFAVAGWWDIILARLGQLAIYINLGGYLTIATVLFGFWCLNFFWFDRQTYMIFTPGQVRVRLEIGGGETSYDTTGMVVQKERGDLFRHWVLGFGSGDLVVRPVALGHRLDLPNVLRVGKAVKIIEQMVKERVIVADMTPRDPTRS